MKVAEVILRDSVRQTDRCYTYKIPAELDVREGSYVSVPFGNGNVRKKAVVTGFKETEDDPKLKFVKLNYFDVTITRKPSYPCGEEVEE